MTSTDKFYVYALIDPINRIPFYIGKGCGRRAYKHLTGNDTNNVLKVKYIKNIRPLGFEPEHCKNISDYLTGKGFHLSKEELVELRQTLTIYEIANKFGISVTPIKKLIQKYKIYKYGLATKVVM